MSARLVCALAAFVLSVSSMRAAPAPFTRPVDPEKLFRDGMDAYLGVRDQMDYPRALKLFEQAAAKGHPLAAGWAGRMLVDGRGADKDEERGLKLIEGALEEIRKRSEDGDAAAQSLYGMCLTHGWGVMKDEQKGFAWFMKAADRGDVAAMTNVGYAYDHGRGVAKDVLEGARWYRLSAAKGSVVAMYNLGVTAGNAAEAVRWYEKAAMKGHPSGAYNLGNKYEYGNGVPQDRATALRWYRRAATLGHKTAKARVTQLEGAE